LGWVGGAAAIFAVLFTDANLQVVDLDIGRAWILLWGLTLVALLVVAVLEARGEPARATV
ncbi:MAG TPA: hypothetical protein VFQ04_07765, partial [Actinomycetes bacterium]|nr:hypothetical protein [Actinomycetes bacterium]